MSLDWNPADHFKMDDVALWEMALKRKREFVPSIHQGNLRIQHRKSVSGEVITVVDDAGIETDFLRALVCLATRAVYVEPGKELVDIDADESTVFELSATFAVMYQVVDLPDESHMKEFVQWNCVHNVWPFWRQHVYDTLKRASLPFVAIPFFSGKQKSMKAKPAKR